MIIRQKPSDVQYHMPDPQLLNPDWPCFWVTSPSLYCEHYVLGCGILLCQFRSLVPAMLPPSLFCLPPHWQSMRQENEVLNFG